MKKPSVSRFSFPILHLAAAVLFTLIVGVSHGYSAPAAASPDTLELPGPEGSTFIFKPVYLKTGGSPLDGVRFIMGDPSGDFRAPPTAVVVGGSFASSDPRGAWMYYLGECEVTEAQYDAVMGAPEGGKIRKDSSLPVTGISYMDAQTFIHKLNLWLYANAMQKLPSSGPFPAYVRLPTEAEWEYAARGGGAVDALTFDAGNPYGADTEISSCEWFSGPTSSHNKRQPVGRLKANPLGLHDMLGNVCEMTESIYYVEYYQGRGGGFVARGGHYLTNEDDLHTAMRTEQPFYLGSRQKGMRPNTKPTMGFRLALGVPLMTDRAAISQFENAWETHRGGAGAAMPAALSVAAVSTQEAVPAQDALQRLKRIREVLSQAGLDDKLKKELDGTEASLRAMAQVRREADETSARVWAKIASERGMSLVRNLKGLAITKDAPTEHLRRRAEEFGYNVRKDLQNYGEIMAELGKLPQPTVLTGFTAQVEALKEMIAEAEKSGGQDASARVRDLGVQQRWLDVTRRHYEKFEKEKRADAEGWRADYSKENPS